MNYSLLSGTKGLFNNEFNGMLIMNDELERMRK